MPILLFAFLGRDLGDLRSKKGVGVETEGKKRFAKCVTSSVKKFEVSLGAFVCAENLHRRHIDGI